MDQFGIPVAMSGGSGVYGGGAGGYKMGLANSNLGAYGNPSGMNAPPVSNFPYTGGVPSMAGGSGTPGMPGMAGMPNMSGMAGMTGKSGLNSMQATNFGGMGSAINTPPPGAFNPGGMAGIMGMNGGVNASNPLENPGQKEEGVRLIPAPVTQETMSPSGTDADNNLPDPPKFEVTDLSVRRLMGFQLTSYEICVRVKNVGGSAPDRPLQVVISAKGSRDKKYDTLETYYVDPLKPGDEVEIVKKASGRQYACLTAVRLDFKATVLESKVIGPPKSARLTKELRLNWAKNPALAQQAERSYQEVCDKVHTMGF